jgi:hypothetical protein
MVGNTSSVDSLGRESGFARKPNQRVSPTQTSQNKEHNRNTLI